MKRILIAILFLVVTENAFSQSYLTIYSSSLPIVKFQSHKYNFTPERLLIFQLMGLGSNSCNPNDTIIANTFTIDQFTYAVRMPFNSAFRSVCCFDPFWEVSMVVPFDVICLSGNDPNFIMGSLIPSGLPQCTAMRFPFKSYDGGNTLSQLGFVANAVKIDPRNDNIVYATAGNNIYKSTNHAAGFNLISQVTNLTKILEVSPFQTSNVFVSDSSGMLLSTNSGSSFTRINIPGLREMFFYDDRPVVYGAGNGVFKSSDNGINWVQLSSLNASCIEINPDDSSVIYVGTSEGVYRSVNGGQTFNRSGINFPVSNQIIGLYKKADSGDTIIVCTRNGIYKVWDLLIGISTTGSIAPEKYSLSQNYPNPFNPETKIMYDIFSSGIVTLKVFDVNGREVATLVNQSQPPGTYEVTFNGSSVPSGIYFYRLTVNTENSFATDIFSQTKKMLLIR